MVIQYKKGTNVAVPIPISVFIIIIAWFMLLLADILYFLIILTMVNYSTLAQTKLFYFNLTNSIYYTNLIGKELLSCMTSSITILEIAV